MLSDEQLIEQIRTELRSELADLNPPPDLLDRLLEPAENDGRSQRGSRERSADRRDQRGWHARVHGLGTAVPVLAAVIVVVVVAAVAFTSLRPHHSSTPAGAGIATHDGKIAFISGSSLEVANPDGSGLRRVEAVPRQCDVSGYSRGSGCFAWSADGKQFAYLAGGAHKLTLYLVGADGQHPRPLTACGDCQGVSWSPDGSQIAVGRYLAGQVNVWVVNAKTGAMRRITGCPNGATCAVGRPLGPGEPFGYTFLLQSSPNGQMLQWSPNGEKIFFIRFGGSSGAGCAAWRGPPRRLGSDRAADPGPGNCSLVAGRPPACGHPRGSRRIARFRRLYRRRCGNGERGREGLASGRNCMVAGRPRACRRRRRRHLHHRQRWKSSHPHRWPIAGRGDLAPKSISSAQFF